jgi:hypothetical protein
MANGLPNGQQTFGQIVRKLEEQLNPKYGKMLIQPIILINQIAF